MRNHLVWWGVLALGLLVETTIAISFLPDGWRPDVTRSLVLWIALTGQPAGGAFLAFGAGLAADGVSGAPLGLTVLLRLALYGLFRPARGTLHFTRLLFLLGPVAVLVDTLMVWALRNLAFANAVTAGAVLGVMARQLFVEAVTLPLVFVLMELLTGHRTSRDIREMRL